MTFYYRIGFPGREIRVGTRRKITCIFEATLIWGFRQMKLSRIFFISTLGNTAQTTERLENPISNFHYEEVERPFIPFKWSEACISYRPGIWRTTVRQLWIPRQISPILCSNHPYCLLFPLAYLMNNLNHTQNFHCLNLAPRVFEVDQSPIQ